MPGETKSSMRLTSPRKRSAEEFIEAAGELAVEEESPVVSYPWNDPAVREDVIKSINLRLPEPYIMKLQYISEATNKSQQAIIREALLPAIDATIAELAETS